jgi:hypothetical protein
MENLFNILYDWEIQLLVLLSFVIQLFLFFAGGLRRCSTKLIVRLSIWIAYLGADMVAVYSLGYLSRHADAHPLAFFWAPFLLVHLGGQDTITAFAMEDNNLWLRHLLNLVVQAVLAVYVFWKSIGRRSVGLLVSGIFVFIVGVIKYGERIWSLRCGRYESLEQSQGNEYKLQIYASHPLDETFGSDQYYSPAHQAIIDQHADYCSTVYICLRLMPRFFSIFVARNSAIFREPHFPAYEDTRGGVTKQRFKLLEIGLGIMYDDIYTKALVLRTRSGIVLRCISHICSWVAFIVFLACNDRGRYSRVDTAIIYSLFIGGLFLDICGLIRFMASPWTWAWLKAHKHGNLARFSWFIFSGDLIGWPEKRPLWSNAMGQYNFYGWLKGSEQQKPRTFSQQCMAVVRKLAALFGAEKRKLLWMSKLLDGEHVKVDRMIVESLLDGGCRIRSPEKLPNLDSFLREFYFQEAGLGACLISIHVLTEVHLSKYTLSGMAAHEEASIKVLVDECQKLSRYMMYLMVAFPSLLPLEQSSAALLESFQQHLLHGGWVKEVEDYAHRLQPGKETLEEIKELWIRLIVYAASKSRPEGHAAQLARGGELLTFVWLQLGFILGPESSRIEFSNSRVRGTTYFLHLPDSSIY